MSDLHSSIEALKSVWDALQPLAPEDEQRLWQKLRLEWNYHSNHIEGNTLTYGETALLLLHGQTHGNHALREYEEMKAHDVGIRHLRSLAADKPRMLSAGDIRDLNRIILKEPYWKPTQTPDGHPTRVEVIPGEYKTLPNSVITATGEIFEYASPVEVPARMQALVDWLSQAIGSKGLHVLEIAAKLHHDFVLIHPFDDGNGRVARMLVNYLLLHTGYPPVIIPTGEKSAYLGALRLADAGDLTPLVEFFGKQLERSLKLGIRAGRGENIDEPGDVEKQVALFVRSEKARQTGTQPPTKESLRLLAETGLQPFATELERKLESLKPLFAGYRVNTENQPGNGTPGHTVDLKTIARPLPGKPLRMIFRFENYKGSTLVPFDYRTAIEFHFPPDRYTITHDGNILLSKPYSQPLLNEEIDETTAQILAKTFAGVRARAESRE